MRSSAMLLLAAMLLWCSCGSALQIYVDSSAATQGNGSLSAPFNSMQPAVAAALASEASSVEVLLLAPATASSSVLAMDCSSRPDLHLTIAAAPQQQAATSFASNMYSAACRLTVANLTIAAPVMRWTFLEGLLDLVQCNVQDSVFSLFSVRSSISLQYTRFHNCSASKDFALIDLSKPQNVDVDHCTFDSSIGPLFHVAGAGAPTANVSLRNSAFFNNNALEADGASVGLFEVDSFYMEKCVLESNGITSSGRYTLALSLASALINGSSFVNNRAQYGGALALLTTSSSTSSSSSSSTDVRYSRFVNNTAMDGAALYASDSSTVVSMLACEFRCNSLQGSGENSSPASAGVTLACVACTLDPLCPVVCPAGMLLRGLSCLPCPEGTYTATAGAATECVRCPAGFYSATQGATSCTQCGAGSSSTAGASYCSVCSNAFVTSRAGDKTCARLTLFGTVLAVVAGVLVMGPLLFVVYQVRERKKQE
eukprot:m.158675 g.158675  ORF g.158675 m.158675 type:complete len:484 (+) comp17027_c0_seq1:362-1813(+)